MESLEHTDNNHFNFPDIDTDPETFIKYLSIRKHGDLYAVLDVLYDCNGFSERIINFLRLEQDTQLSYLELWLLTKTDEEDKFYDMITNSTLIAELWKDIELQLTHFNLRFPHQMYSENIRYSNLFYSKVYSLKLIETIYQRHHFVMIDISNVYDYCTRNLLYDKQEFLIEHSFVQLSSRHLTQMLKIKDFSTDRIIHLIDNYIHPDLVNYVVKKVLCDIVNRNEWDLINYIRTTLGIKFGNPYFLTKYDPLIPDPRIIVALLEDCADVRLIEEEKMTKLKKYFNFNFFLKTRNLHHQKEKFI